MIRGFQSFHPFILLMFYVFAIIGIMLYQHPIFLISATVLMIVLNILLDKGATLKKWWVMLLVMSLLTLVITPLVNRRGNHILLYLFGNQVMLEAVIQGFIISLTLFSIIAIFITFNMIITPKKFLYLFSKWFPKWALLTMLSMRFVPLLQRRLKEIEQIQQFKGLSIKNGSIRQRAHHGMLLIQILLTLSLEESIDSADSMSARGYGLRQRTKYDPYQMQRRDWFALSYIILMGVLIFFGWWLGDGVLILLPSLEPIWLNGREWFYFVVWILFIGFPLWAEGKEILKWKYYR